MKREWKESMGEISGFGGGYEAVCRAMVLAGVEWMENNPDKKPRFRGFEGVFGLAIEDNNDAKELEKAMMDAEVWHNGEKIQDRVGDDCTGAMHHAAINHIMWCARNGWDEYVRVLEERETSVKE